MPTNPDAVRAALKRTVMLAAVLTLLAACQTPTGAGKLKRLNYPAGLTIDNHVSYERAKAFVSPATLTFTSAEAVIENGGVRVSGLLTNPTDRDIPVIVFPVGPGGYGPGGFYADIMPGAQWSWDAPDDPARPTSPPRPPPAPPPPEGYTVPARSEVLISIWLDVSQMKYRGSPEVDVEWTYHVWNEPRLKGRVKTHLPPR
jgi:hypothetical protein